MFDRYFPVLRLICVALAAMLLYQASRWMTFRDPLSSVRMPEVPTLGEGTPETNHTTKVVAPAEAMSGNPSNTNLVSTAGAGKPVKATNASSGGSVTSGLPVSAQMPRVDTKGTNSSAANEVSNGSTNVAKADSALQSNKSGTNASDKSGGLKAGTNLPATASSARPDSKAGGPAGQGRVPGGARNRLPGGMSGQLAELSPELKARVDKIYQSELFGPVIHPMPPALLGVVGREAIISVNGQQQLLKEGADFNGLKLIKVGVNRVLIEENGKEKELMIFAGFGGETLVSKQKDKP